MLTEELQVTARSLGEALQASEPVQKYLKVLAEFQADPEAADLEKRMLVMYEELIARQQRGEMLQRSEIDDFNTLKRQVYQHPRITEREAALTPVKVYFAEIADEINLSLGVEFSTLAQAVRA
jgi:cell fate (sporulation/competence/biofilm development) regulator YlbF (YheA/YmcA/DUF963 family)